MNNFIFVYGRMLRNLHEEKRPIQLEKFGTYMGPASTKGLLFLVDSSYCGMVPQSKGDLIVGDLFKLEIPNLEKTLEFLDKFHSCSIDFPPPHEFERQEITVEFNSRKLTTWVYAYNYPTLVLEYIPGGDFLEYLIKHKM